MPSVDLWMGYASRRRPHASSFLSVAPNVSATRLNSVTSVVASSSATCGERMNRTSYVLMNPPSGLAGPRLVQGPRSWQIVKDSGTDTGPVIVRKSLRGGKLFRRDEAGDHE